MNAQLTTEADQLRIDWPDGVSGVFPYLWLRDTDPSGFHPKTGERFFDLTSVPLDIRAETAEITQDTLVLRWPGADAASHFDLDWIKAHRPGQMRHDPAALDAVIWRADMGEQGIPRADAADLHGSDSAMADWLCETRRYGLSIVTGLADDPEAGLDIARKVGHLRETNFGVAFEVMSKPDPNNLAYTADALPLHTDLTNQDLPPGYQFLHCLANGATGGGSVFCDGAAVAEDLRATAPWAFDLLSTTKIPFRFFDGTTDIRARKTPIRCDEEGTVTEICFNAHLADIVDLPAEDLGEFYKAYLLFMRMLRSAEDYVVATRLRAGEMVVFDNRRVLHGRESFDPSTGRRHLRGCYVDRGEWDSRIRVLNSSNMA